MCVDPLAIKEEGEFFSLARIFHTNRDEEAAKTDGIRQTQHFDAGLYVSIPPKSQCEFERSIHEPSRSPQ